MQAANVGQRGRSLKYLMAIHGLITGAAGVVLIVTPSAIPGSVGIALASNAYLLCYFLGAAELAIAFLSFFGRKLEDRRSIRLIASTFIVFHMSTGLLEGSALLHGSSPLLIPNILLRVIVSGLFWYFGIQRMGSQTTGTGQLTNDPPKNIHHFE